MYNSDKNVDTLYVWGLIGDIGVTVCISDIRLRSGKLVDEVIKLDNSDAGRSQLVVPEKIRGVKEEDLADAVAVGKLIKHRKKVLLRGEYRVLCATTCIWRIWQEVIPMPAWIIWTNTQYSYDAPGEW